MVILSSCLNMIQICIKKSFVVQSQYEYIKYIRILVFSRIIIVSLLILCLLLLYGSRYYSAHYVYIVSFFMFF